MWYTLYSKKSENVFDISTFEYDGFSMLESQIHDSRGFRVPDAHTTIYLLLSYGNTYNLRT